MVRIIRHMLLLALLSVLAACGNAAPAAQSPPTAAPAGSRQVTPPVSASAPPSASAAPTATLAATAPAAIATAAPQPATASGAIPEGLTPEGYHFLGRADAPATLVMYSDFL